MRKELKEFEVELLIFKTFLKYIKEHHMYHKFRCSVNVLSRNKDLFHAIYNSVLGKEYNKLLERVGVAHSPYLGCDNLLNFLSVMRQTNGGKLRIEPTAECQMKIMNAVNGLLHNCLEYAVYENFEVLEKIGGDTFNEVCTLLYGEGFVDKTNELMEKPQGDMRRMIPPQFLHNNKELINDKAFIEFLNKMKRAKQREEMETVPFNQPNDMIWYYPNPNIYEEDLDDFDSPWD